jgi:superoxide dismutase, Fe-Mn family
MDRKKFLTSGLSLGVLNLLPANNPFSISITEIKTDNLTDEAGDFALQPLPYKFEFLEPYMDAETLNLHYSFHHGGAVKGANKDIQMISKLMDENNHETIDFWTKKLSYHFSSHLLHTIFWTNLTNRKSEPKGELLKQIQQDFGSYDRLKGLIAATSKNIDGNGWGVLAFQPYTGKLSVIQCENHEKLIQWGAIPLLVIDVWEHAYYLKYKNKRSDFVDALFNIINWDNVSERLLNASRVR